MSASASASAAARPLAVHSLLTVVFTVPDLAEARRFYEAFGLRVREQGGALGLHAAASEQCWARLHAAAGRKKLQYLSFGCHAQDFDALRARAEAASARCEPHPLAPPAEAPAFWVRHPDGFAVQVMVAGKVSPDAKTDAMAHVPVPMGKGSSPGRSQVQPVRPGRMSHALFFTPDVPRGLGFYEGALGLKLADRSGDGIAFIYSPHGSDHHMLALAKSEGPGLHHLSWAVRSLDEVGMGMEQMLQAGHTRGWGVGRHVLGSNYFYYARDPWGSFCEYSYDIDHIPAGMDWAAGDHPPEDSFYVWGPQVPEDFVINHEVAA